MTIDGWITDGAARHPNKLALECAGESYSYQAFDAAITTRASDLCGAGVGKGDRVAWYGLNDAEVFVLLFACARIGAILVPLNWRLAPAEVATIVADCSPKLVFHDSHFADVAKQLVGPEILAASAPIPQTSVQRTRHECGENDPLLIVYTSGSTGVPKGAVLTQKALVANAEMSVQAHNLQPDDRVLNVLPLFHVGGLNILPTPAFSIGASVILHDRFDPGRTCDAFEGVQAAIVVPTVIQAVMANDKWPNIDLSGLRVLSIGSTDVPVSIIQSVHNRGVPMIQIYGATETAPFAIYQNVSEAFDTVGSLGRAGSRCDIRLMSANGVASIGEPGEIQVRGDNVLVEYWRNPALTNEMLRDGWFKTGDVAICDDDGLFWFADRIKNVIISGGENIYPAELERVLREHPNIKEVAVVGRKDAKWGETPVAVVVANSPMDKSTVLAMFDGKVARYKLPSDVVFVDSLPRNAMGKVLVGEVKKLV